MHSRMRVVLFTSSNPGSVNLLNASHLMNAFPDFEYVYVVVDNKSKVRKNYYKNRIKELLMRLLLRKVDWFTDRRKIEKRVAKLVPEGFDKHLERYVVSDVNGELTEKVIKDLKPDLMIQSGAGILKENIFSIPRLGTLNMHHGIAPELRGVSSAFWAMYYGLYEYIGVTVHFIDRTLDTGSVIIQQRTKLPQSFDYMEAVYQTSVQGAPLLPEAVRIIMGEHKIEENEVKSFYFSSVTSKKYLALKSNGFKPVEDPGSLPTKLKIKKQLTTSN